MCSLNRYFIQAKNINGHSFVSIGHAVKAAQSITMAKAPAACCEGEERKRKKHGCLLSPLRSTSPFAYDLLYPFKWLACKTYCNSYLTWHILNHVESLNAYMPFSHTTKEQKSGKRRQEN